MKHEIFQFLSHAHSKTEKPYKTDFLMGKRWKNYFSLIHILRSVTKPQNSGGRGREEMEGKVNNVEKWNSDI